MAPGTQARVISEWPDLTLGEIVTIIRYDPNQGYQIHSQTTSKELWVPPRVLSNYSKKPWNFKFRKPRKSAEDNIIIESPIPEIRDKLKDVTVQTGSKVTFKCRIKNCKNLKIVWRKADSNCIFHGRFLPTQENEGVAVFSIDNTKIADSGIYTVFVSNDFGSCQDSAILTVTDPFPTLQEPKIHIISSTSVHLEWESDYYQQFWVEFCQLGTGEWLSPNDNTIINTQNYTVENLIPGETYSFRIVAVQNKLVTLPSVAVTLPMADNLRWQQEQFKNRYIELEELSRGRFSVVRRAKDRGTNVEVALKQVNRRRQPLNITQAEYSLLGAMQHVNIIRSMALFDNAPLPGTDTIVLEL